MSLLCRLAHRARYGARAPIRTEKTKGLSFRCLPIASREHGRRPRIRTESNWFLRPACLPITSVARIPGRTRTCVIEFRKLAPAPLGYGDRITANGKSISGLAPLPVCGWLREKDSNLYHLIQSQASCQLDDLEMAARLGFEPR